MKAEVKALEVKTCSRCKRVLPIRNFNNNAARKDGLSPYCKACKAVYRQEHAPQDRAYQKQKYQDNIKERRLEAKRAMRLKRAVLKANVENVADFAAAWERLCASNAYRCFCCGREKPLQVNHILSIAQGGVNDITNFQPLCAMCSRRKGNQVIDYTQNPNPGELR